MRKSPQLYILAVIAFIGFLFPQVAFGKFTRPLMRGARGNDVRALQIFLKQHPDIHFKGLTTGHFGILTEQAVKLFQKKYGIEPNGKVNSKTLEKINSIAFPPPLPLPGSAEKQIASVFKIPVPPDLGCFWPPLGSDQVIKIGCEKFYTEDCSTPFYGPDGIIKSCSQRLACPKYFNPVYDESGNFFPSACWAEQLGAKKYSFGISKQMNQFIGDLWYTLKTNGHSSYPIYRVPIPNLEFSYVGSELPGWKNGVFFRSTLWENPTSFSTIDYDINTDIKTPSDVRVSYDNKPEKVMGTTKKALLVFVLFDSSYPTNILMEWTKQYTDFFNDYLTKKQKVSQPIRIEISPIVVDPPLGMEGATPPPQPPVTYPPELNVSSRIKNEIYETATKKIGRSDFSVFILVPIHKNFQGGYFVLSDGGHEFIYVPRGSNEAYDSSRQESVFTARLGFQELFRTISHELLHSFGLNGDHMSMSYGTYFLGLPTGVDPVTGKGNSGTRLMNDKMSCDWYGNSDNFYGVKMGSDLKIKVGSEPDWATVVASESGNCLTRKTGHGDGEFMKDFDKDGEYDMVFFSNIIGQELQRTLGWVDIDGDGIAELEDPTPYGGYQKRVVDEPKSIKKTIHASSFEFLGEEKIKNCRFAKIKLENNIIGRVPLECEKFNPYITNIYLGLSYDWLVVASDYGDIFIPRLFTN